jgi:hypothetical protein
VRYVMTHSHKALVSRKPPYIDGSTTPETMPYEGKEGSKLVDRFDLETGGMAEER